ncbi:MAG: acyl-protein synthetase [Polyangiaceae bacterium]
MTKSKSNISQTAPDMDARAAASDEIHARVRAFARRSLLEDLSDELDDLACDLARYQAIANPAMARRLKARGVSSVTLRAAADIPAIPTDAFRLTRVASHDPKRDVRVFRTSGTTSGARGEHPLRTLATYREVAWLWAQRMLAPWPRARVLALMPSPAEVVDSSLGYMCELFGEQLDPTYATSWFVQKSQLDLDGLSRAVERAHQENLPVLLLGASFAYVHLLDALGSRSLALPESSRVMLTGGFKGKSREVSEVELRDGLSRLFALPPTSLIGEYGMTELSSQAYEKPGAPRVYYAPPWMRVTAVDPVSLVPVKHGDVGIGRIIDLANVDSAVAIQTLDRVRMISDSSFELLGRIDGAHARGCSLLIEELLG